MCHAKLCNFDLPDIRAITIGCDYDSKELRYPDIPVIPIVRDQKNLVTRACGERTVDNSEHHLILSRWTPLRAVDR